MNDHTKPDHADVKIPPVWLVRIVSVLRDSLENLRRRLAPPHVALLEQTLSFWYSQAIYVAAKLAVADHLRDGPRSIAELATAYPFHETAVVVDVGGGRGTLISTILAHHTQLRGHVTVPIRTSVARSSSSVSFALVVT